MVTDSVPSRSQEPAVPDGEGDGDPAPGRSTTPRCRSVICGDRATKSAILVARRRSKYSRDDSDPVEVSKALASGTMTVPSGWTTG